MDERTLRYYEDEADDVARRQTSVASPLERYFGLAFPRGARVLDVGAGAGRELAELVREGYEAWGVEPSEALRSIAVVRNPAVRERLFGGSLPEALPPVTELGGPFDGVVCSAVLQHLPRAKLFHAAFGLRGLLKERGRALISVPAARPDVVDGRDAHGRLYNGVLPDELELLFERTGFVSIGRWDGADAEGRPGVDWTTLLLELRTAGSSRPIDLIESVLSERERKVATYKLALIRALCSIALTEPRVARFCGEDGVRVPVRSIAERWIDYYWPQFDSPALLPQMNGEREAEHHKLAFTGELNALIEHYRRRGGQTAFALQRRSSEFQPEAERLHSALVRRLRNTIRAGPVTHAGGSLGSPLFDYDDGDVLVATPLWRELSLMGHWIQDALVLRWAELVHRLSQGEVQVERVVSRLIEAPNTEREQSAARDAYAAHANLECVWTGRRLTAASFHVDHVIPYSLWRNNDLWNLLPTHPKINAAKRDLIPETALIRRRRDAILACWDYVRTKLPRRFEREARSQLGVTAGDRSESSCEIDLDHLFEVLVESAEVTALQRASPRWQPAA